MLRSLSLKNFKCYIEKEFILSNLTVFCGNNSTGKSTAIQAILLAFQNNFSSDLDLSGDFIQLGTYSDIHNKNSNSDSICISIDDGRGSISWGYTDNEFTPNKMKSAINSPLPSLSGDQESSLRDNFIQAYKNEFSYLCAERWGPRNNHPYSTQRRSPDWLGIHGEYTPQVLANIERNNKLATSDKRIHQDSNGPLIDDNLFAWMAEISPGVFIKSDTIPDADIATSKFQFGEHTFRAVNVGFGLSYALPIVFSLLQTKPGGLVILENPEAHLHPRGQSYLGRLIALASQAGVQVIIETHSDHLINGIRVATRLSSSYTKNSAKIYYVSSGEEQSQAEEIFIGEQGELDAWPDGFFDQQGIDIKRIIRGAES